MNKPEIIQKIIESLRGELESYTRAARSSHAEATAEENRAESKYDTRGLEASYLAAGQANKVVELKEAIASFEKLLDRKFANDEGIEVGALIKISQDGERAHYFIGPSAGGTEVEIRKTEVLVITPQSPLGAQLQGATQGMKMKIDLAGRKQAVEVLSVV